MTDNLSLLESPHICTIFNKRIMSESIVDVKVSCMVKKAPVIILWLCLEGDRVSI